jgi:pimeloyl-ACP methyl ester carboxylesterase
MAYTETEALGRFVSSEEDRHGERAGGRAHHQTAKRIMQKLRTYGQPPFGVAVIHGGPGACGEMAPVARELAPRFGVLEPIQTATTLDGQVAELRGVLESHGDVPLTLVGFSWGAWLSFILAAHHPTLVKKLILVGSGPFEEKYVAGLREARMSRLSPAERTEFEGVVRSLSEPATSGKDRLLARLDALAAKTDQYDPIQEEHAEADALDVQGDIFQGVWNEAAELRRSGRLLALADQIRCPMVAIHGDYDPHPAQGVQGPLSGRLESFRFILLQQCGHKPWVERQARAEFYRILEGELE